MVAREVEGPDFAVRRVLRREDIKGVPTQIRPVEAVFIAAYHPPDGASAGHVRTPRYENAGIGPRPRSEAEGPLARLRHDDVGEFLGIEPRRTFDAAAQQGGAVVAVAKPVQENAHILHLVGRSDRHHPGIGDMLIVDPGRFELAPDGFQPVRPHGAGSHVDEADRADFAAAA